MSEGEHTTCRRLSSRFQGSEALVLLPFLPQSWQLLRQG
ncbi:hypothetical protein C4K32_3915 [Pseudomonas chlororaphis subsp. piscium]|nr:hypothetical protein C4K32_3915 [Pseudomonas chlororaphis subsp. piscium]